MPNPIRKYTYYLRSIITLLTGIREWPLVVRVFLGAAPPGEKIIHLRRSGLRLKVRGPMDIWSVKEALLDRFYQRFGTEIGDGWTIIDIGAGIGEFTLAAAYAHPQNRVYAFEPFAESFALLEENLDLNRMSSVIAYPQAVGARTGSLLLDLSGGEPLQLQSIQGAGELASQDLRLISSLSLADVFARLDLMRIDLLKLDCEGSEYPIFFSAQPEHLERIRRVILEYHDGAGGHTHQELADHLVKHGFQVRITRNWVHAHLGYLYAWRETS
jgi:FkbM family methyltransferase